MARLVYLGDVEQDDQVSGSPGSWMGWLARFVELEELRADVRSYLRYFEGIADLPVD